MTEFKKLKLSDELLKSLNDLGFEKASGIQEESIPILLKKDVDFIGLAQTGTGKTAAFGLPLLEKIDIKQNQTQALVIAPTRELGRQIAEQLVLFAKYKGKLNVLAVYGGEDINRQIKALKNPQHVIIATPGRLLDLIKRKKVILDDVKHIVLDEADEMLNMGFKDDIDSILSNIKTDYKTWLFSATMPKEIRSIVNKYMTKPVEVEVGEKNTANENITHKYVIINKRDQIVVLKRFVDLHEGMKGVVFCRTKREAQSITENFLDKKYKVDALHGDLSQGQRDRVMKRFKDGQLQLLVATDVAARGLDVDNVNFVFHLNIPDDISYYTHRSGRTARAGKTGDSICLISNREKRALSFIEKKLGINFEQIEAPKKEDIAREQIKVWVENISKQKVSKEYKNIVKDVLEKFEDISKEELIEKIISNKLESLVFEEKGDFEYTESRKSFGGRGGRGGGRGRRGGSGGSGRYKRSGGGNRGSGRKNSSGKKTGKQIFSEKKGGYSKRKKS